MVLAEAFMKRNDLKKQISQFTDAAVRNLWQNKNLPLSFRKGVKTNPREAYDTVMKLMSELQALNIAITQANIVNNEKLRELETVSARIALLESVVQEAARYPGDKIKETEYVGREFNTVILENEWLIDPAQVQNELDHLKEHKRELEKALAHSNFVTEVKV